MEAVKTLLSSDAFNLILVMALIIEGAAIKNAGLFKKVSNQLIPIILIITSVIVSIAVMRDCDLETVLNGLLTAFISVGIHQTTKTASKAEFIVKFLAAFRGNTGEGIKDEEGNAVDIDDVIGDEDEGVEDDTDEVK